MGSGALEEVKRMEGQVLTERFHPKAIVDGDDDRTPASWADLEEAVKVLNASVAPLANSIKDRDPAKVCQAARDIARLADAIHYLRPETIATFK